MDELLGGYDCKLDVKGRLMVPAALKRSIPDVDREGLIICRGFEKSLIIYPKKVWDGIVKEMHNLNYWETKKRHFLRIFTRDAVELTLDAAGRVLLPKSLLDFAEITTDLFLSGQFDKIEVWNKKNYEAIYDDFPEDFAALAEEVMGDPKKGATDGE